jgi:predicted PurR-regulated permease PerM
MLYRGEVIGTSRVSLLLAGAVITAGLYFAKEVLIPFALAALLSFLLAPIVTRLHRLGLGRMIAVWVVVAFAFGLLSGLSWLVVDQLASLANELPRYKINIEAKFKLLRAPVTGALNEASNAVKELGQELPSSTQHPVPKVEVAQPTPNSLQSLYKAAGPILKPAGVFVLVIVLVIFMLLKREDLRDRLIRLMGTSQLHVTTQALDEAAVRIGRYLLMQSLINGTFGLAVAIGLTMIGLPNAILWGLLAGILKFVPYLGAWLAAAMPAAQSMAVFDDWTHLVLTLILFLALELTSIYFIEPWLYGTSTGVTPMALIIAAVFWTWLWGSIGLALSTPLTVCLVVLGKYVPQLEFLNVLLGDEPVLEPQIRLYQRLLATDLEEANDIVEVACKEKPFAEVCDRLLVPALRLIEQDRHSGILGEKSAQFIFQGFKELIEELGQLHESSRSLGHSLRPARFGVLCLPSHDEADEITSTLFAQLLQKNGIPAESVSLEAAAGAPALVQHHNANVVFLSVLPSHALTHTSRLSRRLRTQFPMLEIMVGLLTGQGDVARARERLVSAGVNTIVLTFAEGLQEVQRLNGKPDLNNATEMVS